MLFNDIVIVLVGSSGFGKRGMVVFWFGFEVEIMIFDVSIELCLKVN